MSDIVDTLMAGVPCQNDGSDLVYDPYGATITMREAAALITSLRKQLEEAAPALERLPVAFEVLDTETGMYLTRSEEAAIKSGYEYNGLYRRAAIRNLAGDQP